MRTEIAAANKPMITRVEITPWNLATVPEVGDDVQTPIANGCRIVELMLGEVDNDGDIK